MNIHNISWSIPKKKNNLLNNKDLYVKLNIILFKKINIFSKVLGQEKIEELVLNRFVKHSTRNLKDEIILVIKERLNKQEYDRLKFLIKKYGYLMPNIDKLSIKLSIGTEDSYATSIVFGMISTILNVYLRNISEKHISIKPIFENENILDINLNLIFSITIIRLIRLVKIYRLNIINIKKKFKMYKFDNYEHNI